jgi:hypothetical protein
MLIVILIGFHSDRPKGIPLFEKEVPGEIFPNWSLQKFPSLPRL